ncbi:MAG: chemotaxis protein CheA [Verrucomicrobiaceae bacterium]|nr:chemotaxis protein CheA [Verrucomicrobiaceae bacterium]
MNLDAALQTFLVESRELLEDMESRLLQTESEAADADTINAIFRAAHTIKGSAGLFGLDDVVKFTHVVESVLDKVRDGNVPLDSNLADIFLESCDQISALVDNVANGNDAPDAALEQKGSGLIDRLNVYLGVAPQAVAVAAPTVVAAPEIERSGIVADTDNWHISLRFGTDVFRNGMDPLAFMRYLRTLGEIVAVSTISDALPAFDAFDAESCYLGFEINFKSDVDKAAIEGVFEFVREDARITILSPRSCIADYIELIRNLPEEEMLLGDILIKCGTLSEQELNVGLNAQAELAEEISLPLGSILIGNGAVQADVVEAAVEKQQQVKDAKNKQQRLIRIDADKLDHLIGLIGELVIAGAGANLIAKRSAISEMLEAGELMGNLIEEVRDTALSIRMVQIGETFSRFQRVVRDVSKEIGKDIGLIINGAETELDKTVVEKIGDPLMHLVRNSMDHGIEKAEVRAERGKPLQGTIELNAFHDSGSIVIEVSDDGGGLNKDRILSKAIEKGIVPANHNLSDPEIYKLIFAAGFSTAEQVTNLSGRGVGMDVVRQNIEALRGTISIASEMGVGSTMSIRLPLTLAIIDGFLVQVGRSAFVIPLDMVVECIELNTNDRDQEQLRNYINLRGEVLPYIRLREFFEIGKESEIDGRFDGRENIVVVRYAGVKVGIVVDTLHGEFQTVIKPMGKIFSHIRGIGGSTILATGEVALIIDIRSLIEKVQANEPQPLQLLNE